MEDIPAETPSGEGSAPARRRDPYRNPLVIGGVIFLALILVIGYVWFSNAQREAGSNGLLSGLEDSGQRAAAPELSAERFPDDIPLTQGNVLSQTMTGDSDGRTWKLSIQVSSKPSLDPIQRDLEAIGFRLDGTDTIRVYGIQASFSSDAYELIVHIPAVENGDGAWVVDYEARKGTHRTN